MSRVHPVKHADDHRPPGTHGAADPGGPDPLTWLAGGTVAVQDNGTLVGTEPAIDFEDSASVTWTVTDDSANARVQVSATAAGGAGGPATVPLCTASDYHTTLPVGHTVFDFSDAFATNDGTYYDTIVNGSGQTIVRILKTGLYKVTCQTFAQAANTVTGLITSGWSFSPPANFVGYEFEFGQTMGIAVDDGTDSNWHIGSQQLLNVIGAANVTLARFVDSAASGAIGYQNTDILVERLGDSI